MQGIAESEQGVFSNGIGIGSIRISWTRANESFGYFSNGEYDQSPGTFFHPETRYANVVDSSVWFQNYDTYDDFDSVSDIGDATAYPFTSQDIMFTDKVSRSHRGILLAVQNDIYLAIDPLDIYVDNAGKYILRYQYWYGGPGDADFSNAGKVPAPSALALFSALLSILLLAGRRRAGKLHP